jgi:hypothetical protein
MTRSIDIRPIGDAASPRFAVTIREDSSATHHDVTMSSAAFSGHGARAPEQVVDAAFRFLLDREAKESILARFDLSTIARYFPDFERKLPDYLK